MAVTAADIQGMPSGEFAALADGVITPFIAEATRQLSASVWGELLDDGVRYLAAHLLAVMRAGSKGAAGPVVAETAGPVSRSYAAAMVTHADSLEGRPSTRAAARRLTEVDLTSTKYLDTTPYCRCPTWEPLGADCPLKGQ